MNPFLDTGGGGASSSSSASTGPVSFGGFGGLNLGAAAGSPAANSAPWWLAAGFIAAFLIWGRK